MRAQQMFKWFDFDLFAYYFMLGTILLGQVVIVGEVSKEICGDIHASTNSRINISPFIILAMTWFFKKILM